MPPISEAVGIGFGQQRRDCGRDAVQFLQDFHGVDQRLAAEMIVRDRIGFFGALLHFADLVRQLTDFLLRVQIVVPRVAAGILFEPVGIIAPVQPEIPSRAVARSPGFIEFPITG